MRLAIPSQLVEEARAGDGASIDLVVRELWPHAYRIAYSVVQDADLAQDAAQETASIVFQRIRTLKNAEAFVPWLYRIVVREAMRLARRAGPVVRSSPDSAAVDLDQHLDLLAALQALSPSLRVPVVLHYYARQTDSEIAHALRVPVGTIRYRLWKARKVLSDLLSDRAETLAPEACQQHA
jgi:RNA polymerase sigma factor (sigma-70 family)